MKPNKNDVVKAIAQVVHSHLDDGYPHLSNYTVDTEVVGDKFFVKLWGGDVDEVDITKPPNFKFEVTVQEVKP